LRWGGNDDLNAAFIALSQPDIAGGSKALGLGDVGIHHVGFWTENVQGLAEKLRAAGAEVISVSDTTGAGYGESASTPMRAMFVKDPDGTILQFDERLG
jgi:catechol 2,3-dioxygenase-like lactoylglutathione lyase family enzyme